MSASPAPRDERLTRLRGVAPSILASDFSRLGEQVDAVIAGGAEVIHVDVMDGVFVPPITMGPLAVEAVRDRGALVDVHLMVDRPERHVDAFVDAGADVVTIHAEATPQVHFALQRIRERGALAGLALCPGTPIDVLRETAELVDLALCMTVNPGWGGQSFIPTSPEKIRRMAAALHPGTVLEVDGGVDATTVAACAEAGSGLWVAGSAVFGKDDPGAAVREIAAAGTPTA